MAKKMLIDATHPEETRVVVVDGTQVDEFDFETINKRQLAGNIYLAKVTRVEPSLQAAFVEYGGNRHGFLAFAEIHPDYYQIPAEDRRALLEEERAAAEAAEAEEDARDRRAERGERSDKGGDRRGRGRSRAESAGTSDATVTSGEIPGMSVIDTGNGDSDEAEGDQVDGGTSDAGSSDAGSSDGATRSEGGADQHDHGHGGSDDTAQHHDDDHNGDDHSGDDQTTADRNRRDRNTAADEDIESIADEDVAEELPAPRKPRARRYKIQEVIKVRQIMLVQVVKEERGNKGAALTTYLSLAGRYCVLMPNTARGGGISRKITIAADRKKLKDIASELEVPQGAGLIIRTAGSQRTRTEIRRDYEYLMRLWEQIRELTFRSTAPAAIYEEGDLIKRTIRDLYSKDIDEVLVEGERGFRTAHDFMAMIMPDQIRAVKHYADPVPLFARYQAESFLSSMFNPVVQLKSGGYIVIGITEALVAIDVNSGRATKEGSIEDTAYKTNCEAADEVARQLRLRDLAGLIVIDFIDMDERKNNANVEKRFKDRLKTDRARIQVGRISGFGLMEMSRQRLRPGMLESTTQPCAHCHGTGLIRSDDSLALQILRAVEEEGTRKRSREVLVKAPIAVSNFLINQKREHVALIEARTGMSVRIEADPSLISPDWTLEKFKSATRSLPEPVSHALSVDASLMAAIDDERHPEDDDSMQVIPDLDDADEAAMPAPGRSAPAAPDEDSTDNAEAEGDSEDGNGRGRKRRRRRRRGSRSGEDEGSPVEGQNGEADDRDTDDHESSVEPAIAASAVDADTADGSADGGGDAQPGTEADAGTAPRAPRRRRRSRADAVEAEAALAPADMDTAPEATETPAAAETAAERGEDQSEGGAARPDGAVAEARSGHPTHEDMSPPLAQPPVADISDAVPAGPVPDHDSVGTAAGVAEPAPEVAAEEPVAAQTNPEVEAEAPKPKRRGWWSFGA